MSITSLPSSDSNAGFGGLSNLHAVGLSRHDEDCIGVRCPPGRAPAPPTCECVEEVVIRAPRNIPPKNDPPPTPPGPPSFPGGGWGTLPPIFVDTPIPPPAQPAPSPAVPPPSKELCKEWIDIYNSLMSALRNLQQEHWDCIIDPNCINSEKEDEIGRTYQYMYDIGTSFRELLYKYCTRYYDIPESGIDPATPWGPPDGPES
jgi:hypothetical protein